MATDAGRPEADSLVHPLTGDSSVKLDHAVNGPQAAAAQRLIDWQSLLDSVGDEPIRPVTYRFMDGAELHPEFHRLTSRHRDGPLSPIT